MKVSYNDCFTRLTLLNAIAPAELKDDAKLASRIILMRVGYQKAVGEFQEAMQKVAESLNEAPAEGAEPMTEEQKEAAFAEARKSKAAETVEVPRAKMDAETFAALTAAVGIEGARELPTGDGSGKVDNAVFLSWVAEAMVE